MPEIAQIDRSNEKVATIAPFADGKFLLQLRDSNPQIAHPNSWGLFGGAVESGESYEQSAMRELFEELKIKAPELTLLEKKRVSDLGNLYAIAFTFEYQPTMGEPVLGEGQDLAWTSLEQVLTGYVRSPRFDKDYPVAKTTYIAHVLKLALKHFGAGESI